MHMPGFTKLFNSILHSTIWSESNDTRILWITMLAMSDRNGCVNASVPGLARMAGITVEETQASLAKFQEPDQFSRTSDFEGRRIKVIDGGWHLLNHGKYREMLSTEERREYNRKKQAERRQKLSSTSADSSMTVNDNQQNQHIAEAEADTKEEKSAASPPKVRKEATGDHAALLKLWTEEYPKHHDGEPYLISGGKDGKAASELLKASGKTPAQLHRMFIAAWAHPKEFNCKAASTLSGFLSRYNEIREELNALHPKSNGGQQPPDYTKTEWPAWLKAQGIEFQEYQFAPEFMRGDFQRQRKSKA